MNRILVIIMMLVFSSQLTAQKFFTRNAKVSFHSRALLEDIDADNNQGTFVIDNETKQVQMAVLIKAFQFKKSLMQEHFNENYMESDDFPKATFKGRVVEPTDFSLMDNGRIEGCRIDGEITIHGVTKAISVLADFVVSSNDVFATSQFFLEVADFNIKIPKIVKDNIAKKIEVRIEVHLEEM